MKALLVVLALSFVVGCKRSSSSDDPAAGPLAPNAGQPAYDVSGDWDLTGNTVSYSASAGCDFGTSPYANQDWVLSMTQSNVTVSAEAHDINFVGTAAGAGYSLTAGFTTPYNYVVSSTLTFTLSGQNAGSGTFAYTITRVGQSGTCIGQNAVTLARQ